MEYVAFRRFKDRAICGDVNLPYGTILTAGNDLLTLHGKIICARNSENGHRHFAPNDDGQGLTRGAYTYAIAFAQRGDGFRFTDAEREILLSKWYRYLRNDVDTVLFNNDFFAADIDILKQIAADLNITVKE